MALLAEIPSFLQASSTSWLDFSISFANSCTLIFSIAILTHYLRFPHWPDAFGSS